MPQYLFALRAICLQRTVTDQWFPNNRSGRRSRAVWFYRSLGFDLLYGSEAAAFTSFRAGSGYLNLTAQLENKRWSWWGRVIFYVDDVDALHALALAAGYQPSTEPRDAGWGERYFHLSDPDGHELSFARPLR